MLSDGSWNQEKIVYYTLSERYPYDGAHNPDPHAVDFETVPDLPATAQLTGLSHLSRTSEYGCTDGQNDSV